MKILKEWTITVPWGKLALISWGNPKSEPILLVHGRQDSVTGFYAILDQLPNNYYYVAFDLPGHGYSDPFPPGTLLRINFVAALEEVLKHLKWNKFIYMSHSMGCEIGFHFHITHPNLIKRFIWFDPSITFRSLIQKDFPDFYKSTYERYFTNYEKYNSPRVGVSKARALQGVMKARDMTTDQAELALSRNLVEMGDDLYRYKWDSRLTGVIPLNIPYEPLVKLFCKDNPPTLILCALSSIGDQIIDAIQKGGIRKVTVVNVVGNHDVHILHPDRVSKFVNSFLKEGLLAKL